jgi:transcriptional regulator with XRE-family HTH domain
MSDDDLKLTLQTEFQDEEYRQVYFEDFMYSQLAIQVVKLRQQRGWTQKELAAKIGTQQPGIARLEDVNYRGWTLATLIKLAAAFDVALDVMFIPFTAAIDKCASFNPEVLEVEGGFTLPCIGEKPTQV